MHRLAIAISLTAALGLACASSVWAGAPAPASRKSGLPRSCKDGVNGGVSCSSAAECPGSSCSIDYAPGETSRVAATLTIMADDNVSAYDHNEGIDGVVAVTVLLELEAGGETKLITQTYQNLFYGVLPYEIVQALGLGPTLSDTFGPVKESNLEASVQGQSMSNDMLFQQGDSELAAEILSALGRQSGTPVVKRIGEIRFVGHTGDGLGSILRVPVHIRIVD